MTGKLSRPVLLLLLLWGYSASLPGQQAAAQSPYYEWFDSKVGIENTELYNGIIYKEQYRTINENTRFFDSPDFLPGMVVYEGQPYYKLLLKYDVFQDQVLLKIQDRLGGNTLQLFGEKISAFELNGHRFVRIKNAPADSGITGFYEISLETDMFTLLTKHHKNLFDRKDRSSLYYEFLDADKGHILYYRGDYYELDSKRDVTELFPDLKKQIDDYYNRARNQRRTDPHAFTVGLMQRIGTLLAPNQDTQ